MALKSYVSDIQEGNGFVYRHATVIKSHGAGPNEPGTFKIVDSFALHNDV